MDLLGGPLEALIFRYTAAVAGSLWAWLVVLAAVAGSLWAWLVVLAAALGIWRIRAVGFISAVPPPPKPPAPLDPTIAESGSAPASAEPSPSGQADGNATPKAQFIEYFHADDGSDEKERGDGEATEEEEEEATWGWGRRIVRKRGHLGCFPDLDRTAFNGSVDRLWEGNVELTVTAGRVRRRPQGWNGN